jgi:hypothetical protein
VPALAVDAARGLRLGAQALQADLAAAVDAHAVAAVLQAAQRGAGAARV